MDIGRWEGRKKDNTMSESNTKSYGCGQCKQDFECFNDYMAHSCIGQIVDAQATDTLSNNTRETWLHGWPRGNADVLIGTGVYCLGCGKDHGITTVAIPEGWEYWVDRRPYPDWPFDEKECPICYLSDLHVKCRENRESDYIQVGKNGMTIRTLRERLPK